MDIAVDYLVTHAADLGLLPDDLKDFNVNDQFVSGHTDVTHIHLQQTHKGLDVADAFINVNVTTDGRVINVGSSFASRLNELQLDVVPRLNAVEALELLASSLAHPLDTSPEVVSAEVDGKRATILNLPELSPKPIHAELQFTRVAGGKVELAWKINVETFDGGHWYDTSVSTVDGDVVFVTDWMSNATYRVYPLPLLHPDDGDRTLVIDTPDPIASPIGWHDTHDLFAGSFTDTRGNNVFAQEDRDANDVNGFRPDGGSSLEFDFPIDSDNEPISYQEAAITNLFYINNVLHDLHYRYGFDEPAGNFQVNNFGRGGIEGDPVIADAQDGYGRNTASFAAPPDGTPGRMQVFLYDYTTPNRDGSLDNEIIIHEYGHGVSSRLTGGPKNARGLSRLQSKGMSEGWSDWWMLALTQESNDDRDLPRTSATYAMGQPSSGAGNRRFPYSFSMDVNPLTYEGFNGDTEEHNAGEIWASALWDMNWNLIEKYGYSSVLTAEHDSLAANGNTLTVQLAMDGIKLQPVNPSFLDGRDAILMADLVLTGGVNQPEIWSAFARRGMGASAIDGRGDISALFGSNIAFSPDGKHAYVGSGNDDSIIVLSRDLSGKLTFVEMISNGESGIDGLANVSSVLVSPDGKYLYAVGSADSAIVEFERNLSTGSLSFKQTIKDDEPGVDGLGNVRDISVSPNGKHLYAAGEADNAIAVFGHEPKTDALSFVETFDMEDEDTSAILDIDTVKVSPDGANVYATSRRRDTIAVLSRDRDNGQLTFRQAIRDGEDGVDGISNVSSVAISPDSRHVYAAGTADNAVAVFDRNLSTGQLTFRQAIRDGDNGFDGLRAVMSVTLSADGRYVYAAGYGDAAVAAFSRDESTGMLEFIDVKRDGIDGGDRLNEVFSISVSPDGKHLYSVSRGRDVYDGNQNRGNALTHFHRDVLSGKLEFHSQILGRGPNEVIQAFDMPYALGDANMDGVFDSADLIQVFKLGEYDDRLFGNSDWKEGDWNGDRDFDSSDLIAAFQAGGYKASAITHPPAIELLFDDDRGRFDQLLDVGAVDGEIGEDAIDKLLASEDPFSLFA